jgi:hypothetical protein
MGAPLVWLAPYFAPVLIESFRKVIAPLAVSENTSIAIIACFTFLSHFSGFGNMATFVESVPVIHHFAADLSPFLAQIPDIVREMSPLGLPVHKVLLRLLLPLFRDSLNFHIVAAVSGILARFPEQLLSDVLGHPIVFDRILLTNSAFATLITSAQFLSEPRLFWRPTAHRTLQSLRGRSRQSWRSNDTLSSATR